MADKISNHLTRSDSRIEIGSAAERDAGKRMRRAPRPRPGPDPSRFRAGFEILRELDAFADASDGELAKFAALGRERRVERGRPLFPETAESSVTLALVLEGEARLTRGAGAREPLIRTLEEGDLLGEAAMFDDAPDEDVARAQTPVRLIEWDRDAVREALRRWPDVTLGLFGCMARGQRDMSRRVAGLCRQRAPRRLARALSGILQDRGVRHRGAAGEPVLRVRHPPTRARLAEVAGMARETASRLLVEWERLGWLARAGGDLLVLDERALRRVAGEEP